MGKKLGKILGDMGRTSLIIFVGSMLIAEIAYLVSPKVQHFADKLLFSQSVIGKKIDNGDYAVAEILDRTKEENGTYSYLSYPCGILSSEDKYGIGDTVLLEHIQIGDSIEKKIVDWYIGPPVEIGF